MNLNEYKKKYPRLEQRLTSMEKKAKIAQILLDLKEHEGMKMLVKELEERIIGINTKLLSSKRMEVEEREMLLTDKERCMWLLEVFNAQETALQKINAYLKKL